MKILPIANISYNTAGNRKVKDVGVSENVSYGNSKSAGLSNAYYPLINGISFKKAKEADFVDNIRDVPGITCACCGIEVYPYETVSRIEDEKLLFFMPEAVKMLITTGLFNPKQSSRAEQEAFKYLKSLSEKYPDKSFKNVMDLDSVQEEIQKELSPETRDKIKYYRPSLKELCRNSKDMIEIMQPYEKHFSGVYKDVFELLKKNSAKYPSKDFNYILNTPNVYFRHLAKLQRQQKNVVNEIEYYTKINYPKYQKFLKSKTKRAKDIIFDEDTIIPQKRQRIIDNYETLSSVTSPEYMEGMRKILSKLPKSSNSLSAFIAKYSYRSSEEIAHLILVSGASSEEHIKPQNRDKKDKGSDINENKIVMCAACNSQRSKTSYKDWLLIHPEMIQNCQKYIDKIIDAIISGKLVNYNDYPQKVKKSLSDESGGMIEINIDRYKDYYENHPTYKHPNKQI